MKLNFNQIKRKSEGTINKFGANINSNLPMMEYQGIRNKDEVIKRVTIMAGMVYIAHQAPPSVIRIWIEEQGLYQHISEFEKGVLEKK
jgi:uncharacterized protein (DUF2225 family)